MCSDLNKPNGQYQLPRDRDTILDFSTNLTVGKVPGIGRVQGALLTSLDIHKLSDVLEKRGTLWHLFSPGSVEFYLARVLGLGGTVVSGGDGGRSSMSTETTFSDTPVNKGLELSQEIVELLHELSETLAQRLKAESLAGQTMSVKLKLASFEVLQRSKTVDFAVSAAGDIEQIGSDMLKQLVRERSGAGVVSARLLGVRVSNFAEARAAPAAPAQRSILSFARQSGETKKWECPVCGAMLPQQVVSFNKHVDLCIAGGPREPPGAPVEEAGPSVGEQSEAAEKSGKWECPVCEGMFPARAASFNEHVDNCILKSAKLCKEAVKKNSKPISDLNKKSEPNVPVLKSKPTVSVCKVEKPALKLPEEQWQCPICEKFLPPKLASFNKHIDRCISGKPEVATTPKTTESEVDKSEVASLKSRKRKSWEDTNKDTSKCKSSILKYFKVV